MSDPDDEMGGRAQALKFVFWSGVGLALLAALLLVLGGGAGLRLAGAAGVLAVAMIGISIALRPDIDAVRSQLEEGLLGELDSLREELREDIASAARVSHQSFGERIGALQQQVDAIRSAPPPQVARAAVPPPPPPPPPPQGPPQGPPPYQQAPPPAQPVAAPYAAPHPYSAVPHTAAQPYPAPQQYSAPPHYVAPPPVSAPAAAPPAAGRQAPPPVSAPAAQHAAPVSAPAGQPAGYGPAGRAGSAAAPPPAGGRRRSAAPSPRHEPDGPESPPAAGRFRRTETVQVTRSTSYVDEPEPRSGRRHRDPEQHEESWTDQKLRERYGRTPQAGDSEPVSGVPVSPPSGRRSRSRRRDDDESDVGARLEQRWAAVRDDGSELQLGERRAARHRGESGSEIRIEDRWAAARREDDRNGYGTNGYGSDGYDRDGYEGDGYDRDGYEGDGYDRYRSRHESARPDYGRPALPAGREEPSWNDSWEEEPVRAPRGRLDFELSDDRWR